MLKRIGGSQLLGFVNKFKSENGFILQSFAKFWNFTRRAVTYLLSKAFRVSINLFSLETVALGY